MDDNAKLPWTDEQWSMLNQLVQDVARKVRVMASFLPLEGPLPQDQAYVPAMQLDYRNNIMTLVPVMGGPAVNYSEQGSAAQRISIDGSITQPLVGISCPVYITAQQAKDPELGAIKQILKRMANVLARLEDEIVLNGLTPVIGGVRLHVDTAVLTTTPDIYTIEGPADEGYQGLLPAAKGIQPPRPGFAPVPAVPRILPRAVNRIVGGPKAGQPDDTSLVTEIVGAIQRLERAGFSDPFACVLGTDLFLAAVSPAANLILPSERILPFLKGGPLLRSVSMAQNEGLIIALGGDPIDLAVGSDLSLKYISRSAADRSSLTDRYCLTLSETFRLRIKESNRGGGSLAWIQS
jgi:uncharacterized linocin/CFP29 family protein